MKLLGRRAMELFGSDDRYASTIIELVTWLPIQSLGRPFHLMLFLRIRLMRKSTLLSDTSPPEHEL
jgi:hypothetical protein